MAEQDNVSKILSVLSHKIRREILLILQKNGETTFTELMKTLNVDTGKLSFHIRGLTLFIEQTESGKYKLNRLGEDAVRIINDVESWAELANIDRKGTKLALAAFRKRAYAFLIDFGIMFIFSVLLLLPTFLTNIQNWLIISFNLVFITLVILWGYSTVLEGFRGQTIGKRALRLLAIRADNRKIDYEHAAVRNFGKVLLPFDLVFGYWLSDPRFIRYFDKFAGTTVIDLRARATEESVAPEAGKKTKETNEPTEKIEKEASGQRAA